MKKSFIISMMLVMVLFCATPANASDMSTTAEASAVSIVFLEDIFEANAINMVSGRAGSMGPGAKGNILEALYTMQQNAKDLFNGTRTALTKSSVAQQVDLVKMKAGKVVGRIQCKDTPNSVGDVISQVKSNKYQQAKLVGTTESAKAFNAEAAKKGITKTMQDSGISTKTTGRVADKMLGKIPSATELTHYMSKAGTIGAALEGIVCLGESIVNESDVYTTIAHTTAGVTAGFVSGAAAAAAAVAEVSTALVIAAGGSGFITVAVPIVTSIGVGYLVCELSDSVIDEEVLADSIESMVAFASECGCSVSNSISVYFAE